MPALTIKGFILFAVGWNVIGLGLLFVIDAIFRPQ